MFFLNIFVYHGNDGGMGMEPSEPSESSTSGANQVDDISMEASKFSHLAASGDGNPEEALELEIHVSVVSWLVDAVSMFPGLTFALRC